MLFLEYLARCHPTRDELNELVGGNSTLASNCVKCFCSSGYLCNHSRNVANRSVIFSCASSTSYNRDTTSPVVTKSSSVRFMTLTLGSGLFPAIGHALVVTTNFPIPIGFQLFHGVAVQESQLHTPSLFRYYIIPANACALSWSGACCCAFSFRFSFLVGYPFFVKVAHTNKPIAGRVKRSHPPP